MPLKLASTIATNLARTLGRRDLHTFLARSRLMVNCAFDVVPVPSIWV